jgi:hypothetical protein
MTMTQHCLPPVFQLEQFHELATHLHLSEVLARGYTHVVLRELLRHAPDSVLPERARVLRTVEAHSQRRVVAEVDDCLVLLETWKDDAHVFVSGNHEPTAVAIADEIKVRVPQETHPGRVDVTFVDSGTGSRRTSLDVRSWKDVSTHYPDDVRGAMDRLVGYTPDPASARRLVLWHGGPGTGKTTAVRALLHAWRDWADAVVVTDPERLLADGRYLRRILLDVEDDDRWRLLVLEDAESLLRKSTGGSGMGKLLNLTDGLLGQGLRCLFLITTNEPLGVIHPAIVRPGRCLAQVEFGPLSIVQASRLLGRPADRPMTLAEVMTAAPVETDSLPVAVGQYL